MGYYSPNPHYAPDDFSDDTKRVDAAVAVSDRYFRDATKPQYRRYVDRLAVIGPCFGSPKWKRESDAAKEELKASTAAAVELCKETYREVYETGEVSDELSYRWDALIAANSATVSVAA
jgi:hypothetical protein